MNQMLVAGPDRIMDHAAARDCRRSFTIAPAEGDRLRSAAMRFDVTLPAAA